MMLESVLASLHLVAILAMVVFSSSQAALCRREWLNAAVVRRLLRLDWIFLASVTVPPLSGVARVVWASRLAVDVGQPLFHIKMTLCSSPW